MSAAGIKDFEIVKTPGVRAMVRKLRPREMDEWTHARHLSDGNPVSRDALVAPTAQLRWVAGPLYGHHRAPLGAVTANGRLFYASNTNPLGVAIRGRYVLFARDAYNGKLLWKRPIPSKKGYGGRYVPAFQGGALLAAGDRVYCTLGPKESLASLDAATGEILTTYGGLSPEYAVHCAGTLILMSRDSVRSVDAATGRLHWTHKGITYKGHAVPIRTSALVVGEGQVFFREKPERNKEGHLVSLALRTGKENWRKDVDAWLPDWTKSYKYNRRIRTRGEVLLASYYKGVCLLGGRGGIHAVSAEDGAHLWSYRYDPVAHYTEIYGMKGLVWVYARGAERSDPTEWIALDPASGKERKRIALPKLEHRLRERQCGTDTVTERYFIPETKPKTNFIDTKSGKFVATDVARNACRFRCLPANGLLYCFPKDCKCFPQLRGTFAAVAVSGVRPRRRDRLEKGPAYGKSVSAPETTGRDEWPCYRHDARRSGSTPAVVGVRLNEAWKVEIGGRLSAPVVAEGKAFVAAIDRHQVLALDERSGGKEWSFTAGGRVDSPPTIHRGLCVFGCRNGWVYCLRASDGRLVWRFLAAPEERRIAAFDQLESPWPVFGSVLVHNDAFFFSSGIHSEAEGGVRVYALEPATGRMLWQSKPTSTVVNDLLQLGSRGRICLSGYNSFDPKTGKTGKGAPRLNTSFVGFLGKGAANSWARLAWQRYADLTVFDGERSVEVYCGKRRGTRRLASVPGEGYEIVLKGPGGYKSEPLWELKGVPVRINSTVLTRGVFFAAGPVDLPCDPEAANPWAVLDGEKGGKMLAISAADGKKLSELRLDSAPVFDGMAAAGGRLYLSCRDGRLRCFGKK